MHEHVDLTEENVADIARYFQISENSVRELLREDLAENVVRSFYIDRNRT